MSVHVLCCTPHGSSIVLKLPKFPQQLSRKNTKRSWKFLLCSPPPYFPFGVWVGAKYRKVHSGGWIVCRYIQCCSHSSANKPVLPEVRIFWIYEYFSVSSLYFTTIAPLCCRHCYWLFLLLKYSYLLVVALPSNSSMCFSDGKNSRSILHFHFRRIHSVF